ncbi:MAG: hypothetical protein V1872_01055 [bacterium]
MINTLKLFNELSQTMDNASAQRIADAIGMVYEELQNTVTKVEFRELRDIVRDLGQAQNRTEIEMKGLADAQKRTEIKVEELADVQKRTEVKVGELVDAQKRTEGELMSLTRVVKNVQKELGGLSNTVGYELEDKYYRIFPKILKEDFNVLIKGKIERKYIIYSPGNEDEIDIYGKGSRDGKDIYIIGEAKAQLGKNDVKYFSKLLKRVKDYLKTEVVSFFLCYSVHPLVEEYIQEEYPAMKVYKSYELSDRV